ncbi:MAG: FtsQ-type POTRA domain-containing protein [Gammaproteobacteria bacterium]|nr:FtsQ-type POTRA domain-containing protein [Gammaproteobacteria bacterium]
MGAKRIVKKPGVKKTRSPAKPMVERWLTRRLLGGVLLFGGLGSLLGFTVWQLAQPDTLPIQQVQVKGEFVYLDKKDLYKAIGDLANAGFFNVNVRAVKQAAETMPWVDSASVRRIWPDTLHIDIREQIPLARWQGGGMVNRHGDVVPLATTDLLRDLPVFNGPEGTAKILAERYQLLSVPLEKMELTVVALSLSERRAWQVSLDNGMHLLFGRAMADTQLSRFTNVYYSMPIEKLKNIQSVDLRYTNGFAVRWKTPVNKSKLG